MITLYPTSWTDLWISRMLCTAIIVSCTSKLTGPAERKRGYVAFHSCPPLQCYVRQITKYATSVCASIQASYYSYHVQYGTVDIFYEVSDLDLYLTYFLYLTRSYSDLLAYTIHTKHQITFNMVQLVHLWTDLDKFEGHWPWPLTYFSMLTR